MTPLRRRMLEDMQIRNLARCASRRRAGARYQRTRRGARKHAARQAAWRRRRACAGGEKVTHQGYSGAAALITVAAHLEATTNESTDAEPSPKAKHVSMTWAQRLKRVFAIDIERCRRCGGRLKVIASIEEPALIERYPLPSRAAGRGG